MSDWRKFGLLQRGKFESGPNIRPFPATCAGRVKMLHTHALTDTTMPLAGRYLGKAEGMWARIAQANRARASVARRTIAGGGQNFGRGKAQASKPRRRNRRGAQRRKRHCKDQAKTNGQQPEGDDTGGNARALLHKSRGISCVTPRC